MNDKEISITYDGTRVIIETNDDSINISRIQAYNLIKLLQNLDASYNLKGRDITEKEWDRINSIIKRCLNLKIHESICFKIEDKDLQIALLNQLADEKTLVVTTKNDVVTITKTEEGKNIIAVKNGSDLIQVGFWD